MSYRSYNYKCTDCDDVFVETVEFELRDLPQECPVCAKQECPRTWEGYAVAVSTAKTSQTIPDVVAKGRFDNIRKQQELRKAKGDARWRRDRETEKMIDKEIKERKR